MRHVQLLLFFLVALPTSAQVPASAIWEGVGMGLGVDLEAPTEADSLLLVASLQAAEAFQQVDAMIQTQAPGWERVARHNAATASINTNLASAVSAAVVASASGPGPCRDVQVQLVRFGLMGASVESSGIAHVLVDEIPGGGAEEEAAVAQLSTLRESIQAATAAWSEGAESERE